jgi:hypothetical protein
MAPPFREEPPLCDLSRSDSHRPGGIARTAIANSFSNFLFFGEPLRWFPNRRLSPHKQPSDTVALLALPITRQSVTCASGAFRPICFVRRAFNIRSADLPVRRLPTRLTDARGAVVWRSAFGAPSHWFLSSAHARTLLRRFVTG